MAGISNIARFCMRATLARYSSRRLVIAATPLPMALKESSTIPALCSSTQSAL